MKRDKNQLIDILTNTYLPIMRGKDTVGEYHITHSAAEKLADALIDNGVLLPTIAYVCDGKSCETCPGLECHHTIDIHHAKNFTEIEPGRFMENE